MPADEKNQPSPEHRITRLETLFMDLQRTVEQLDEVVREQASRVESLEKQLQRWREELKDSIAYLQDTPEDDL